MALEKNLKPLKLIQVKLIISGFSSKVKLGYENLGRMTMGEAAKKHDSHAFTSFDLTKNLLNNLQQFKITPTAKLVLLYLASCYNPKKADMFPKQKTIADKIGVSERSVVRAISELFKAGLIIIECKYTNRYKFTSKIVPERSENLSKEIRQNDIKEDDKLSCHDKEQIKRKNKLTNDEFLIKYAESRGVKNKVAYINAIKRNGGDLEIVKEMKQAQINKTFMQNEVKRFIENDRENRKNAVEPPKAWKELKLKLGGMNYVDRGMEHKNIN